MILLGRDTLKPKFQPLTEPQLYRLIQQKGQSTSGYVLPQWQIFLQLWDHLPTDKYRFYDRIQISFEEFELATTQLYGIDLFRFLFGSHGFDDNIDQEKLLTLRGIALFMTHLGINVYAGVKKACLPKSIAYPIDYLIPSGDDSIPEFLDMYRGKCVLMVDDWTLIDIHNHLINCDWKAFWKSIIELYELTFVKRNPHIEKRQVFLAHRRRSQLEKEYLFRKNTDRNVQSGQLASMISSQQYSPKILIKIRDLLTNSLEVNGALS